MSLTKYEIKNANVLAILEDFRYTYRELYQPEKTNDCLFDRMKGQGDKWTSDEHLQTLYNLGEKHDGGADTSVCYPIKPNHYHGTHPEEYRKTWVALDAQMKEELGVRVSALSTLYPPEGFIGWHNNANAAEHNLIFTWSEHGDGWFKFIEPSTGEEVIIQDDKGWNLKAGYFGAYGSDDVVYHCARTNCFRMTLSYTLGHDYEFWRDCVDYITNP